MTVPQLTQKLKEHGLSTAGLRDDLYGRWAAYYYEHEAKLRRSKTHDLLTAHAKKHKLAYEHEIIFTPPGCPFVQPIEKLWGQVKQVVADLYNGHRNMKQTLFDIQSAFYTHKYPPRTPPKTKVSAQNKTVNGTYLLEYEDTYPIDYAGAADGGVSKAHVQGMIKGCIDWMNDWIAKQIPCEVTNHITGAKEIVVLLTGKIACSDPNNQLVAHKFLFVKTQEELESSQLAIAIDYSIKHAYDPAQIINRDRDNNVALNHLDEFVERDERLNGDDDDHVIEGETDDEE
jgi:hypothetical protein